MKKHITLLLFALASHLCGAQNIRSAWGDFGITSITGDTLYGLTFRSYYGGLRDTENDWRPSDFQSGDVLWVNCVRYPITHVEGGDDLSIEINTAGLVPPQPGDRGFITAESIGAGGLYGAVAPSVDGSGGATLMGLPPAVSNCITNYYNLRLSETNHAPFRSVQGGGGLSWLVSGTDSVRISGGDYLDTEAEGNIFGIDINAGALFSTYVGDGLDWNSTITADVKSLVGGTGVTVADTGGVWTIHASGGGSSGVTLPIKTDLYFSDSAATDGAMAYRYETYAGPYLRFSGAWVQQAAHGSDTKENAATGVSSTVSGGAGNMASADFSTISGGATNSASDTYTTVGGGRDNSASGIYSTVGGGRANGAEGSYSGALGGRGNVAGGSYSIISGGQSNSTSGIYNYIGSGTTNSTSSEKSAIITGDNNTANADYAVVISGTTNTASGAKSVIITGENNTASGLGSAVFSGSSNTAGASYSSVLGGVGNSASAYGAVVLGGSNNTANEAYSLASGSQATASNFGEVAHNNGVSGFGYSTLLFTRDIADAEDAQPYTLYLDGSSSIATLPNNGFFRVTCDWLISRGAYQEATGGTFSQNIQMVSGTMTLGTPYAVSSSGATLGINIANAGATFWVEFTGETPFLGPVKAAATLQIIKISN